MTMTRLTISSPYGTSLRIAAALRDQLAEHIADGMESTVSSSGDTVVLLTNRPDEVTAAVAMVEPDAWVNRATT